MSRQSHVKELEIPAVIVTVVPEMEHFALIAVAGTVEAPSIDAKVNGVP